MRWAMSRDTLYSWGHGTNNAFLGWEMTSIMYGQTGMFFAMFPHFLGRRRRLVFLRI